MNAFIYCIYLFIHLQLLTVFSSVCLLYIQLFGLFTFLIKCFSSTLQSYNKSKLLLKFIAKFYCICTPLFMPYTVTDID